MTNYRVIVSCGPGAEDVTSVYLDQLDEPAVQPYRDGTGDVLLLAGSGGAQGWRLTRLFQPGEIALAPGEDVLWTGGPNGIPWWFGGRDVYLTVFALVWLAFVTRLSLSAWQTLKRSRGSAATPRSPPARP